MDTSTTSGATSTTSGATSTTSGATSTTSGATTTTSGATTTTSGATSTTSGATSTTSGATTTTSGATSTTSGATSTTSGQSTGKSISSLVEDLMGMFPNIKPDQLTQLMNSGIDISKLMPSINNNGTVLSDKGINSQYRGPSTNILQKNYKGATNVYSPFLYYNKGTTEKFTSTKQKK